MYLTEIALMCTAMCVHVIAMTSENAELQTRFLKEIYETVKDRQLENGELNLLRNESIGFASAVHSVSEKGYSAGTPQVTDGNRAMTFNLSMLTERKQTQVLMQLAIKLPTQQYFQSAKYLELYKNNRSSTDNLGLGPVVAAHTLYTKQDNEWLELTIDCDACNCREVELAHFVLQLTDVNNMTIVFTEETASDLKSFLIIYTHESLFHAEIFGEDLSKRQVEGPEVLNRTTLAELLNVTTSCSKHEVLLSTEELLYRGTVISPYPGTIPFTYCFGKCDTDLEIPYENATHYDIRTRILMHNFNLHNRVHPPPCCIPSDMTSQELLMVQDGEIMKITTIPSIVDCKCQL